MRYCLLQANPLSSKNPKTKRTLNPKPNPSTYSKTHSKFLNKRNRSLYSQALTRGFLSGRNIDWE